MTGKINYPFMIRPLDEKEGGGFLIEFPDFPGCIADGTTIEEAIHAGEDALKSWVNTAKEFGDDIPDESPYIKYSGQWRIRVPKSLHAQLAYQAKLESVSLNMLAATLLAEGIGRHMDGHSH